MHNDGVATTTMRITATLVAWGERKRKEEEVIEVNDREM